ncbi:type 4a pilus biogenesis protein PilO [Desulfolucanica intricata]|uniref:type 4a pilus biogenesis protein PilO n=1 Tax=Desulfolucanica intricata TaxID=1285191 RepID=UPI00082A543E|nr:type 4a pilus biogenesis protein PilO [Desulfolucanica intricata]
MIYKIKEKLLNLSLREKTLIGILACLVFVLLTVHQYNSYYSLQKQLYIKRQQIIQINKQIASLPGEKAAMKKIQERLQGKENYFSREINDGTALEIIGLIANNCNLRLNSFIPQEPVVKDYYNELPVKCVITGEFSKLITFVEQIEHQPNLIVIKDMVLENPVNKNETNDAIAKISLVMYSQRTNIVKKDIN